LKHLYHLRWNIEEAYKKYKELLELSNYSGKTALSIKQDFYAKVFMMNVCAVFSFPIEQKINEQYQNNKTRKYEPKANQSNILNAVKEGWVSIFIKQKILAFIKAFDKIIEKTTDIVRPNRKFKRKMKPKNKPAPAYKGI
jgi:hypothetical protein